MLTLTRKIGESIRIGDNIVVVVKEIKGKQVRLGIEAPRDVYVCREELFMKIKQANEGAIAPESNDSSRNMSNDALAALGQLLLARQPHADSHAQDGELDRDGASSPKKSGDQS